MARLTAVMQKLMRTRPCCGNSARPTRSASLMSGPLLPPARAQLLQPARPSLPLLSRAQQQHGRLPRPHVQRSPLPQQQQSKQRRWPTWLRGACATRLVEGVKVPMAPTTAPAVWAAQAPPMEALAAVETLMRVSRELVVPQRAEQAAHSRAARTQSRTAETLGCMGPDALKAAVRKRGIQRGWCPRQHPAATAAAAVIAMIGCLA
mmetsp:Transcript_7937/g.21191  ORF Transcript_7937/g.21191 Transcript_7937/m.21191 type:complete len:206 (+) Transcript_7937:2032-2649(+)